MDENQILQTFELFNLEKEIVEIRIMRNRGILSGYYNNAYKAISDIKKYDGRAHCECQVILERKCSIIFHR